MDNLALSIGDLAFAYAGKGGFALGCDSFSVAAGERVLLLGESGSGKSTLLSLICGILAPQQGTVVVAGEELSALKPAARDTFRAENIGVIFQQFNLLPYATALDNVLLPLRFARNRRVRAGQAAIRAAELMTALGLPDQAGHTRAREMSVGQQQRVAVARALIGTPGLIVADEPTSALDAHTQAGFLDLLFAQCAEAGSALLMVSHDARIGDRFDRVVDLDTIVETKRASA